MAAAGPSSSSQQKKSFGGLNIPTWPPIHTRGALHHDWDFISAFKKDLKDFRDTTDIKGLIQRICELQAEGICSCGERSNYGDNGDGDDDGQEDDPDDATFCPHGGMGTDTKTFYVLDQLIPRMDQCIGKLQAMRAKLVARADSSRTRYVERHGPPNPGSEIRRFGLEGLSPEVLCLVASMAERVDPLALLNLSQVSQDLRRIILAAPLLWTNIDILEGLTRTAQKLDRSGSAPLSIRIHMPALAHHASGGPRPELFQEELLVPFISAIKPHSSRIRSYYVHVGNAALLQLAISPLVDGTTQTLNSLDISTSDAIPSDFQLSLGGKVKPRHLTFRNVALHSDLKPRTLFCGLKSIELQDMSPTAGKFRAYVSAMPQVESMVLENIDVRSIGQGTTKVIPCERLLRLRISHCSDEIARWILRTLSTPALTNFEFDDVVEWRHRFNAGTRKTARTITDSALLYAVSKNPQIQTLDIENCTLLTENWIMLLRWAPFLQSLRFASCELTGADIMCLGGFGPDKDESLLTYISEGETSPYICPQLSTLIIDNEPEIRSSDIKLIVEERHEAAINGGVVKRIARLVLRGVDGDKMLDPDLQMITGLVKSFDIDTFDGEEVLDAGEDSETDEGSDESDADEDDEEEEETDEDEEEDSETEEESDDSDEDEDEDEEEE